MTNEVQPTKGPSWNVPAWVTQAPVKYARIIKAWVLSQSKTASVKYAEHHLRMGSVAAFNEHQAAELRNLSDLRKEIVQKQLQAGGLDALRLENDLRLLDETILKRGVYIDAQKYLEAGESDADPDKEILVSWLDRFDEYARKHNEPWRGDLLARALAREARYPGSIGTRALWFIGTIEEDLFHLFGSLVDLCSNLGGGYTIPGQIPSTELVPTGIGSLMFGSVVLRLNDLGLHNTSAARRLGVGFQKLSYGNSVYVLECNERVQANGIVLSELGETLAALYTPKPNAIGQRIFDGWLDQQRKEGRQLKQIAGESTPSQ